MILCFCRVFLALCEDPKDRGTIVAEGGGKVITRMFAAQPDVQFVCKVSAVREGAREV